MAADGSIPVSATGFAKSHAPGGASAPGKTSPDKSAPTRSLRANGFGSAAVRSVHGGADGKRRGPNRAHDDFATPPPPAAAIPAGIGAHARFHV